MKNTILVNGKKLVCRIFDAEGQGYADRYTIAFKAKRHARHGLYYPYLSANAYPFHPQGIGMHGQSVHFLTGRCLGKRITFEQCPADVQKFILQNI